MKAEEVVEVEEQPVAVVVKEECITDSVSIYERLVFSLYAPHVSKVELAGDFSGWVPILLRKDKHNDGMWTLDVSLKPGVYEYKFVVDGAWIADPENADTVDDTHGGRNSLVSFMPFVTV